MSAPTMTPVKSGFLEAVGYDDSDDGRGLVVLLKNGRGYRYPAAPADALQRILEADSPGKQFNSLKPDLGDAVPLG